MACCGYDDQGASMKIETSKLLKDWRESGEEFVSLVFVAAAGPGDAMVAVAAAISQANGLLRGQPPNGATEFSCTEPWPGPRGPVFVTHIADTVIGLERWTQAFAEDLRDQGWDGVLTTETENYPAVMSQPTAISMTSALAVTSWRPAPKGATTPGWRLDSTLRDRLVNWAVDWVSDGSPSIHLGLGMTMFERPVDVIAQVLASPFAMGAPGPAGTRPKLINSPDSDHIRWVTFTENGIMLVKLRSPDLTWEQTLAPLSETLTAFSDISEFGLVRYGHANAVSFNSVVSGWPPPRLPDDELAESPVYYYGRARYLDTEYLPDASGQQVVGDGHLTRFHDLSNWDVTDLGGGKHLVAAKDQAAWFASDTPRPELVEQARRDFGDVILRGTPAPQPDPPAE
jgi:hypothetical protein